jgi:hypothetical protein
VSKDVIKKDESPPTPFDPILRHVEAFQEGYNMAMLPNPHIP